MAEKIDVAEKLKEHFEAAGIWHLEGGEFTELTEADYDMSELFLDSLLESVDAVPSPVMLLATKLATTVPESFREALETLLQRVGPEFRPATADEFVQALNRLILTKPA